MSINMKNVALFAVIFGLIAAVGIWQSWSVAFAILNLGLISALMSLGVNMQWGYAGLFNVGTMGFVALGGLATVLVAMPPVKEAWAAGGGRMMGALAVGALTILAARLVWQRMAPGRRRGLALAAVLILGFIAYRWLYVPAANAIESIDPASTGYLGGLDLEVLIAWPVGGLLAAGAAWIVAKTALGLRSDYLAIATLGIAEIIVAVMKNEEWLDRGVKNVIGIPRPFMVPYEVEIQQQPWFLDMASGLGTDPVSLSSIWVKLLYAALFTVVLLVILWMAEMALKSPWGRMMRAIRDNEVAAEAMGKDVTARHLQIFVLGSAVIGIAGAMLTTLDGQLTPGTYNPLRFTFLIWVMVIVGGSGNNWGAILGGFLIWFLWVEVEALGPMLMEFFTFWLPDGNPVREHLMKSAAHMRLLTMGVILLLVLRFSPRGLIPEK